jgi:hypothetical protein
MSIASRFIEIARQTLDPILFQELYDQAVAGERKAVEEAPTLPARDQVHKPVLAARIEAELNDLVIKPHQPHIQTRLEERMELDVGPNDLGQLARLVQAGGSDVKIIKRQMQCILYCEVNWRGKDFVVLYNQSQDRLITAFLKMKKKRSKVFVGKQQPVRKRLRSQEIESYTDEC